MTADDAMYNDQLFLTVGEAAKLLRLSRAFTYELVARGDLPSVRFGRRIVVPRSAIERMVADLTEPLLTTPVCLPSAQRTGDRRADQDARQRGDRPRGEPWRNA